jgi:uncharacterized small protein (TIGR04563 family)
MPYYVQRTSIDWHYDEHDAELSSIVALANQRLSSRTHTAETFEQSLRELASQHPELRCDALIEDGFRFLRLFRAARGDVSHIEVEQRPEDALASAIELPLDDMADVRLSSGRAQALDALLEAAAYPEDLDGEDESVQLPLQYKDAARLRAAMTAVAAAIEVAADPFVAEVETTRYLVELKAGNARVARLKTITEPELVARLLAGRVAPVPQAPLADSSKYEQTVYLPDHVLANVREHAARTDRSLSYIAQHAYKLGRQRILACTSSTELADALSDDAPPSDKRKQTLYFSGAMLKELRSEAQRLDVSLSRVLGAAWALAQAEIEALPSADP